MKGNQKEPKLTYALDAYGKMVYIGNVEKRGLSCNCRCPKCNEPLVAKLGYVGGRQRHFAHRKGSDCHGSYMTALHKLAEQIIEEEKAVMAPEYKEIGRQSLSFVQVEKEQRVERKDLQPDIVGVTKDGLRWIIEIRNTHEVNEAKKAKLRESNITCLEIDVREQTLENLKSFILESAENREWINNPNYETQIIEAKRKKVSYVENYLLRCTELTIPAYENYASKRVSIKEAIVLSKTADKLFSQVKVLSSDGTPYVFNIGYYDNQEINSHRKHEAECNELIISTDNLSLDMTWLYHFVTEKEREEKAKGYRNNPKYDNSKYFLNDNLKSAPHVRQPIIPKEIEKPQRSFQETSAIESLPFDKFWTTEDYFGHLKLSNSYKTKIGYNAEIFECDIVCNKILLLYKDPIEVRPITPYHIAVISVNNGNLTQDDVAVFTNRQSAMETYLERLSAMQRHMRTQPATEIYDTDLPF